MENQNIELKVKEILISVLNLRKTADQLSADQPLFGTDDNPGLFDDSLAVLEVTSVLMAEFDLEASVFSEGSFRTIGTLVACIENAKQAAMA
ncbi:acyl carrier protein [Chitinophaga vietnamensis]|uniref:acyl carrier protein n=1 Tax=Chitinophaga vietnamensis TaxID=2593957 RepID=UPI0011774AC2|nr:acyl carrier protein [Chitinophaga vietnamensis]